MLKTCGSAQHPKCAKPNDEICNLILVFISESLFTTLATLNFKAQISTQCANRNKSENTHFALLLMSLEWVSSGKKVMRAHTYTENSLYLENERTAQPHTTGWSNLHHRSPGSCSKCIQSGPTHTKVWCAKNAMCPCADCLYPGQRERSLTSFHTGLAFFGLWYVNSRTVIPDPTNSHYVKGQSNHNSLHELNATQSNSAHNFIAVLFLHVSEIRDRASVSLELMHSE